MPCNTSLIHCSLRGLGMVHVRRHQTDSKLITFLKGSWHFYCAVCKSRNLKFLTDIRFFLHMGIYFITAVLLVAALWADGALKPEDNPFLELGHRSVIWDGTFDHAYWKSYINQGVKYILKSLGSIKYIFTYKRRRKNHSCKNTITCKYKFRLVTYSCIF